MAWRRPGDNPLSEPMMARLPTHICVTRPQWVKSLKRLAIITTNSFKRTHGNVYDVCCEDWKDGHVKTWPHCALMIKPCIFLMPFPDHITAVWQRVTFIYRRCSLLPALNTLEPRQNGRQFPEDIFKCIFQNENVWISLDISLKFVPKVQINIMPVLVQIIAWRRPGDKPLSEPIVVNQLTHISVIRSQCVNTLKPELPPFCTWHFQQHFSWRKTSVF